MLRLVPMSALIYFVDLDRLLLFRIGGALSLGITIDLLPLKVVQENRGL